MKTDVRISLDADVLDELDRRSMAAGIGRSAYVSALLAEQPLLVATIQELCTIAEGLALMSQDSTPLAQRARELLKKCQTATVQSDGGSRT